ncbi:MAG TPA: efflux RND transporter permease subunit [Candidatus Sumerlaeota bacterium]|nr:efflux RND transporter permease subunit [Candidatus Sumerlaeota bacterium]
MIRRIIEFSLANKFIILLMMLAIVAGGIHAAKNIRLDAIPDLSDVQVIILTEYAGQAPRIVEDQVTYPITTKMLAVPYAKVVRGYSFYNYSFVYVIFEDGTDMYWARSRVLEYLSQLQSQLPDGVSPQLGPDATGVGWAFQYTLTSDARDLAQLRSLQDWFLKYELTSIDGVAEVASLGGFERQYQVTVEPEKLRAYDLSITAVRDAIRKSNNEVGGRTIEMAETDYMLRGMGYLGTLSPEEQRAAEARGIAIDLARMDKTIDELEAVALGVRADGTPILLRDVGRVAAGPEMRRGVLEWNGKGEAVGGIVVVRYGADTLATIARVRERLAEIRRSLPEDVRIHVGYDRTALIERAIATLRHTLIEESVIVSIIIILFLLHFRSALVPILTLPLAVLISFVIMHYQGLGANIMSLGGIAIAIGAMVDASIIVVENVHKHYETKREDQPHWELVREACVEVGPTLFFALLVITVSFMPIFTLEAQEGRMFRPLAFTKTYAMAASAFLAVTVSPVLAGFFIRRDVLPPRWSRRRRRLALLLTPPLVFLLLWLGTRRAGGGASGSALGLSGWTWVALFVALATFLALLPQTMHPEERNPISRGLVRAYQPFLALLIRSRAVCWAIVVAALLSALTIFFPYLHLGREFMPPLYEGDLLYMPTTLPGISATKARELLQQTDKIIAAFPEVESVYGKIGRAETATDPAPMMMIETTIRLKDEAQWPAVEIRDDAGRVVDRRPRTSEELTDALNREIKFPGLTNAWTMPIKTRIDMLSTGIKTPVGIKIGGSDLATLERIGEQVEAVVRDVPGTLSVYAERVMGDRYVNFIPDRQALQRYGLTVADVQEVFITAIGGMAIANTVEGLERYSINLRYPRELRDNIDELKRVVVPTPQGFHIPLGDLGVFQIETGPAGIKSEQSRPNAWVYVDLDDIDVGTYVEHARAAVDAAIADGRIVLPAGYSIHWSGQYEYMVRARARLRAVVPLTLLIILVLIYLSTGSAFQTFVVMACLPFSLLGAFWMLYWLDYNLSVAVWVGIIALAGLDAETSQVMLLYLDLAWDKLKRSGARLDWAAARAAVLEGAATRLRPKAMTVGSTLFGLLPIMWASGAGADTMKRIAVPMIGGMITSFILEMAVIPVVYYLWKTHGLERRVDA